MRGLYANNQKVYALLRFLPWKEDEQDNSRFKLDKFLLKLCDKARLLELLHDFVLFDGGVKMLPGVVRRRYPTKVRLAPHERAAKLAASSQLMKTSVNIPLLALTCVLNPFSSPAPHANETSPVAAERAAILAAAAAFCTELHREPVRGLPSAAQLQRLSPHLTPEIVALIERADVLQQEFIRNHPDEKPPWIEGDLFSSLFEGVTSWELGEVFSAPTVDATVKVHRTYFETGQPPVTWTDTLVFKNRDHRWLLDNIRMGGDWAFKTGSSLRGVLPGGGRDYDNHPSLDERWNVRFTREDEHVTGVTIQPADSSSAPVTLFGHDKDEPCPMPTWIVWGPYDDKLALRLGDSPRFTRTLIFRLDGGTWKPVAMPEFYPDEKATMQGQGFRERDRLIDAEYWQDADTLVVNYFGLFEKGDEGDGYHKLISVRIDAAGQATVIGAVDAPEEE